MYDTVIFDLDGTLLDTLDDLWDGVNHVLKYYGYPLRKKSEIRSFVGNGIYRLIKLSLPKESSEEDINAVFFTFEKYYTSHCRIKTKPYEGVLDLLNILKEKGYKLAIVSNKNDAAVKELTHYYFKDSIETAIGQKEGVKKKPAPDTVNEAIKILQANKENVLYVGDSEVDKKTSDNAEVDCILVDWGFRDRELLEKLKPKSIISKPKELVLKL